LRQINSSKGSEWSHNEAILWASSDGDLLGKSGHPISAKVGEIVEILTADEDEPSPPRTGGNA
jgi:hypothetical protein